MTPGPGGARTVGQSAGTLFGGRYVLGDLLGVGGSASVFAAEVAGGSRPSRVALKVLHPHLCADERVRAAFLAEARRAEQLRHPNVVAVRDAGVQDAGGVPLAWIAFDLVEGPTLAEWVDSHGRLSPADAAVVLDGLLAGLGAAHARGLVHRDVSPRNVILAGAGDNGSIGTARLLDFGLADVAGRSTVGGDVLLAASPLSEPAGIRAGGLDSPDRRGSAQTVVGSVHYMSPEQAQGQPVGPAGDLYQAGAVLYFLLTGRPPFPRETTEQVLQAHLLAPPPVPSALVAAARPLDRVVTRAMAKDPARRYADAAEFRTVLAAALPVDPAAGREVSATRVLPVAPPVAAERRTGTVVPRRPPPAPGGLSYLDPPMARARVSATAVRELPRASGSSAGGAAAAVTVLAVVAVAVWAVVSGLPKAGSAAPLPSPSPTLSTPSPAVSRTPRPSLSPTTAVATVTVPTLYGTLAEAGEALRAAGLEVGEVTRAESAEAADRVLGQSPEAGKDAAAGSVVDVVVASGSNAVPTVEGMSLAEATAVLQSAGFVVAADRADAGPADLVAGTAPPSGAVLRVGVTVTLLLAEPTPSQTPPATPPDSPGVSGTPSPAGSTE